MAKGITILEGVHLRYFYAALGVGVPANVYRVRVWAQGDGPVKFKVNEGTWTWALGQEDQS
jgi:hypothetical protein